MKRIISFLLLFVFTVQAAYADDPPGAKLYGTYCGACHGAGGKGGGAPAIGSEQYLKAKDDAAITRVTSEGTISKGMPAWSKAKGGALTDDQITNIVAYLRSLAPTSAPAPSAPAPVQAPTTYTVYLQTKLAVQQYFNADNDAVISVSLRDYIGFPIRDATVHFTRPTNWGVLELGSAKTDENGIATLVLSQVPASARDVTVTFKGNEKFDAVTTQFAVSSQRETASAPGDLNLSGVHLSLNEPLLAPEGSLITPNPPLLPTVLFLLVVGSVWATYAFVWYQAYGIWKRRGNRISENALRIEGR